MCSIIIWFQELTMFPAQDTKQMKLRPKIIRQAITEIAGEDVVPLVDNLKNKKNVSEFKLADNLKEGVNTVRNKLYRLHDFNLVSFMRKKDKQKGWYIYYWTFNMKQLKFIILNLKEKKLAKLKERLKREKETQFYMCPNKCMRLDFDQAMNFEFKCPECGKLLNIEDNSEKIKSIQDKIKQIESEIKESKTPKKTKKPRPKKIKTKKRKSAKKKIKKQPKNKPTKKKKIIKKTNRKKRK